MEKKHDLFNIKEDKNLKKPLIYGVVAFLIFIMMVIAYAIYANSRPVKTVLPPTVSEAPTNEVTEVNNSTSTNENFAKKQEENISSLKTSKVINEETKKQPIQKKEEKVSSKISETKQRNVQTEKKGNYYIQVGALIKHKEPDKKFLEKIKKAGFDYKLYHMSIVKNGETIDVTKILIGPFDSINETKKNLKVVKEKINKNAFIFKVKE